MENKEKNQSKTVIHVKIDTLSQIDRETREFFFYQINAHAHTHTRTAFVLDFVKHL